MPADDASRHDTGELYDDVKAFWTPERMREAQPAMHLEPQKRKLERKKREALLDLVPQFSPHQLPRRQDGRSAQAPAAFNAVVVANPTMFPYSTVGKLFYTQGGVSYVGSAAVIYTNSILTVAHNLFSFAQQVWSQNVWFVPAYTSGAAPFGGWNASSLFTMPGYNGTGSNAYDVGIATIPPTSTGVSISHYTGYLGLQVNQGWDGLVFQALAYPAAPNPPYSGEVMWSLTGPSTGLDPGGTMAVGMESNFTTGASGGPWLHGGAQANGVSSYGYPGQQIEYSPYFDNNVLAFFNAVRS